MKSYIIALISLIASIQASSFDDTLAKQLMGVAGAAYCHSSAISSWDCSFCKDAFKLTQVQVFDNKTTDSQAFVGFAEQQNAVIVSYRGTDPLSITDWLEDLQASKLDFEFPGCSSCLIHKGFWDVFLSTVDDVVPAVEAAMKSHPRARVWVTGHSLGGALAVHSSLHLAQLGFPVTNVHTFGEPRVGNQAFAQFWNQQITAASNANITSQYRVTHNADPVPHLPPVAMGFYHVTTGQT